MFTLKKRNYGPIAIDFGNHTIRMLQLEYCDKNVKLGAAGSCTAPFEIRHKPAEMDAWYAQSIRTLLNEAPFKGKKCITAVPGKDLLIQHIRMPKQDQSRLASVLNQELEGKLPFSTKGALLRHVVSGEVYQGTSGEPQLDVIVMAAPAACVHRFLRIIQNCRLMTENITTESNALMKAFGAMESFAGQSARYMLVDLGYSRTRVQISAGHEIKFGRSISLSYSTLQRSIMKDRQVNDLMADEMICQYGQDSDSPYCQGNLAVAVDTVCNVAVTQHIQMLVSELQNCLRYHEMSFHAHPVERVVFLGGLVKNINFCHSLARNLCLPAQIGDPIAAILSDSNKLPQCLQEDGVHSDWTVAYGLALPALDESTAN